jgi:phage/plasmid primase-like uncharacterized protein
LAFCDAPDGRLLVHCYGGCEFSAIFAELVQYGLLDDDDGDLHVSSSAAVCQRDDDQRRNKVARACAIYASGVQDERIVVYSHSRGIHLISPILRFAEQAPHRLGALLTAMLAPIIDIDGEQTGTHLTYLQRDGSGKAELPREFQRETRGLVRGGAIRLFPFDLGAELLIAEGVETALSASEIFSLPAWSAVYAGGLRTVNLPPEVRRIVIAADNDRSGCGQRNSGRL